MERVIHRNEAHDSHHKASKSACLEYGLFGIGCHLSLLSLNMRVDPETVNGQ